MPDVPRSLSVVRPMPVAKAGLCWVLLAFWPIFHILMPENGRYSLYVVTLLFGMKRILDC